MRILVVVAVLLAGPGAFAQRAPEIDRDAVERHILECRALPAEARLPARLERFGIAPAPAALDLTVGLEVSRLTEPAENPTRAAAGLAGLLGKQGDAAYRSALAYYILKDMAFYRDLNCRSVDSWYRHAVVYGELRSAAAADDPNRAYYERSEENALVNLAQALRAGRRHAEKEAALLAVLGFGGE